MRAGDKINVGDSVSASIARKSQVADGLIGQGVYEVTCVGARKDLAVVRLDYYRELKRLRDIAREMDSVQLKDIEAEMEPLQEVRWKEVVCNKTPTVGLNYILDSFWKGSTYTAAFYMGLVNTGPTFAAGDTMSSHAGWTENVGYSASTRPAPAFSSASGGSIATSSAVSYSINASGTIAGVFMTTDNTKSGTTGTLTSAGAFAGGDQAVVNTDTLNVTYTYTAASTN